MYTTSTAEDYSEIDFTTNFLDPPNDWVEVEDDNGVVHIGRITGWPLVDDGDRTVYLRVNGRFIVHNRIDRCYEEYSHLGELFHRLDPDDYAFVVKAVAERARVQHAYAQGDLKIIDL